MLHGKEAIKIELSIFDFLDFPARIPAKLMASENCRGELSILNLGKVECLLLES